MSRNVNLIHLLTTSYRNIQRNPDYILFKMLFTNGVDIWVGFLHVGLPRLDIYPNLHLF